MQNANLRAALGRFATGIAVVTAIRDGRPAGLTINSFASVSLDPPLVLWSLSNSAPSRPVFAGCTHFAINVLSASQRELSAKFCNSSGEKFAGVDWTPGLGDAPVLASCIATFECRKHALHPGGDHTIFLGAVERHTHSQGEPLLFYAGRYGIAADYPVHA